MTATTTQPDAMTRDEALKLIALDGAAKGKRLAAAKDLLPENSSENVDFTCRISGSVMKGASVPGGSRDVDPALTLFTRAIVAELLGSRKVTSGGLKRSLRAIATKLADDGYADSKLRERNVELQAAFDEVAAEIAAGLPKRKVAVAGKAAAVRTEVSAEFE